MIYSLELGYEYMDVPKTGTQTMRHILLNHYKGVDGGMHKIRNQKPSLFSFAVVRNPYARAVSMWWSTCKRGDLGDLHNDRYGFRAQMRERFGSETFENFLKVVLTGYTRAHLGPSQSAFLQNVYVVRVLHLETLNLELPDLPFWKGGFSESPVLNETKSERLPYTEYLSEEAIELVLEWAFADFQRYGYSSEPSIEDPIYAGF